MNEIETLINRLPELHWKIQRLKIPLTAKTIPSGIFYTQNAESINDYMDEIQRDLNAMNISQSIKKTQFLAQSIAKKINTLVRLCKWYEQKMPAKSMRSFSLQGLKTRQNWILSMEETLRLTLQQKEALARQIALAQTHSDQQALLTLKKEYGELEKEVTEIQEAMKKVK